MKKVAALVPTTSQRGGYRDDGRYLTVGCALAAQLTAGEQSLRGKRATYGEMFRPDATKGAR